MRLWWKLKLWRSAWGRYIYLGVLGLLILFGLKRIGGGTREERSWPSMTMVGGDIGRFTRVSFSNAMIVQRRNQERFPDNGKVENREQSRTRRDIADMPQVRTEDRLNERTKHSQDLDKRGTYLQEPTDPHTYSVLNKPRDVCFDHKGNPVPVPMIIFVASALGHLKRRDHIRVTYGSTSAWELFNQTLVRTVFMLGTTDDPVVQSRIDDEARIYGDVVQEDFLDSYLNLTRKTIMGLKWVTEHCRHARFAMKIDDDTMLNKARIVEFLLRAPSSRGVVIGNVNVNIPVVRSRGGDWGKYHILKEFYPASTYPPYLSGPAFIMSTDVVEATYLTALTTPIFPFEDVFMGMCFQKMGISLMHDYYFMCTSSTGNCYGDAEWPKYAVFIDLPAEYMVRVWVESSLYAEKQQTHSRTNEHL